MVRITDLVFSVCLVGGTIVGAIGVAEATQRVATRSVVVSNAPPCIQVVTARVQWVGQCHKDPRFAL